MQKSVEFLRSGVHLLVVDLLPAGPRDPGGIARAIWDVMAGEPFPDKPGAKPLTVAASDAGEALTVYAEDLAVGDVLPGAPLFLAPGWYVNVPLEETYMTSWGVTPRPIRDLVAPEGNATGSRPEGL